MTEAKGAAKGSETKDKETGKELTSPITGEVVNAADAYAGYEEDVGGGFENQTRDDTGTPWIVLMQPLSPEVSAEGSEIKPGMWVNRSTNIFYPEGIDFIPALTRHVFREWSSKDPSGSAPVQDHEVDSPLIARVRNEQKFSDYHHPDNPEHPLVETFEVYGTQLTPDGAGMPAVIAFSSTHIRPYKDWMTKARSLIITLPSGKKINPPLFSHVYRLKSKRVEKKPHIWWVPEVSFVDPAGAEKSRLTPQDDLYQMSKALSQAILAGEVKAAAQARDAVDQALNRGDTDDEKAPY